MRTTELLASLISDALTRAQAEGALPPSGAAEVTIERPQHAEHGDYSSSLPLKLARPMQMSPAAIGQGIVDSMAPAEAVGIKLGKLAQPLRVAVTGSDMSPSIDATLLLVGRERTLARIDAALAYIAARGADA